MSIEIKFEQIVEEHQDMVFRMLARLNGPEHLEDLAQEVFLRLYRALPKFRGDAQMATYLYRITLNVAQTEWKRRRREERRSVPLTNDAEGATDWLSVLSDPGADAGEQMVQEEFRLRVEREVERLSDVERAVLVLFHQEERSYEQIAETIGAPVNTVRTHLHRARKKLRVALDPGRLASKGKTA